MRSLLALPLLGLTACTPLRTAAPADYAAVTAWASEHASDDVRGEVRLRFDGRPATAARDVRIGPDTTAFFHLRRQAPFAVPTSALRSVEVRDASRGLLVGAGAGAAAGLALGGAMALPVNSVSGDWSGARKAGTVAASAVLGGVIGGLVGRAFGLPTGYRFVPR